MKTIFRHLIFAKQQKWQKMNQNKNNNNNKGCGRKYIFYRIRDEKNNKTWANNVYAFSFIQQNFNSQSGTKKKNTKKLSKEWMNEVRFPLVDWIDCIRQPQSVHSSTIWSEALYLSSSLHLFLPFLPVNNENISDCR